MPAPPGSRPPHFVPRATLVLAGGVALFFAVALLYSLPVFLEPLPAGATPDYLAERVRTRLEGVVFPFLALSLLAVAVAVSLWRRR